MTPITREELFLAKAAGENVETPEPITRKEKFLDRAGHPSWDAVKDKPFYDESVTIEWDGDSTGKVTFSLDGAVMTMCLVSERVLTADELIGATLTANNNGEKVSNTILAHEVVTPFEGLVMIQSELMVLSAIAGTYEGLEIPVSGTYFVRIDSDVIVYIESLTYDSIKKLDPKYLPEGGVGYEETYTGEITIEWDGDPTGKPTVDAGGGKTLVKISDNTPEKSDLLSSQVVVGGESGVITEDMIVDGREEGVPLLGINDAIFICYEAVPTLGYDETGTYVMSEMSIFTITYTGTETKIKKIDPKYLPEGIGYENVTNFGDTLTWDGTPTDTMVEALGMQIYKVSDDIPTPDEVIGGNVTVLNDGEYIENEIVSSNIMIANETVYGIATAIWVVSADGASCELSGETIVFPKKGIYFTYVNSEGNVTYITKLTIPNYNFTKTEVHKIDKKFLPDDIGGGLPVVELSTPLTLGDLIPLTGEEIEQVKAGFAKKCAIVITELDGTLFGVVAVKTVFEGYDVLQGFTPGNFRLLVGISEDGYFATVLVID